MCHSSSISDVMRQDLTNQSFLFDDTGENISTANPWLGDLTGLYWVWKNTTDEWVGTNQYRRFYDDDDILGQSANDHTIWISIPLKLPYSMAHQYRTCHGDIGWQILQEASQQGTIGLDPGMIEATEQIDFLSPANMFFSHRKIFDKVCAILFDIIFELHSGVRYSLPYIQTAPCGRHQTRILAFLAERVLTLIYINRQHFLGNVDIVPIRYYTLKSSQQ